MKDTTSSSPKLGGRNNAYWIDGGEVPDDWMDGFPISYVRACGVVVARSPGRAKTVFMRGYGLPWSAGYNGDFISLRCRLLARGVDLPEGIDPEPPEGLWDEDESVAPPEPFDRIWDGVARVLT